MNEINETTKRLEQSRWFIRRGLTIDPVEIKPVPAGVATIRGMEISSGREIETIQTTELGAVGVYRYGLLLRLGVSLRRAGGKSRQQPAHHSNPFVRQVGEADYERISAARERVQRARFELREIVEAAWNRGKVLTIK